MIFELSLFICYIPIEHQTLTALNMAAYRYCNASMLQSPELHDLETVLMVAIIWDVTPYNMPTIKANLASPIIRFIEAERFPETSAFFSGRRGVTC